MMLARNRKDPRYILLLVGSLLLAVANCSLQGATCYNDDGTIIEGDVPCHPDAEQSYCCGAYWTCLDSGVCSDQNTTEFIGSGDTLLARATCTDRTYGSSVCPQFCLGDLGRGITLSDTDSSFCCQQDLDQPCNEDPIIKALELGKPETTISLATASITAVKTKTAAAETTTSSSKPSKTSASHPHSAAKTSQAAGAASAGADVAGGAASTSQKAPLPVATAAVPSSSGLSEGAKIGIAVGVTLVAVTVIAGLLFLWYKRRERRKRTGEGMSELSAPPAKLSGVPEKGYYAPVNNGIDQAPQEMEESRSTYSTALRGELATESLNPRAELSDPPGQKLAADQRQPSELQ